MCKYLPHHQKQNLCKFPHNIRNKISMQTSLCHIRNWILLLSHHWKQNIRKPHYKITSENMWASHCDLFYLFGVLHRFQHCTGHITMGSWKGRGNQYIQFVRVLYCKLPTNGKQLPAFPLKTVWGSNPGLRGGRQECNHSATVAPMCSSEKVDGSFINIEDLVYIYY